MRWMRGLVAGLLLTCVLSLSPAFAAPETYTIDREHSVVGFTIRHLFTQTRGLFKDFTGQVTFDEKKKEGKVLNFKVDVASIDTRNEKRDGHLRSPDFFDAKTFPTITFESDKSVKFNRKNKAKVKGKLTMHGVTKPVTLDVEYLGSVNSPFAPIRLASFSVKTTLNRQDYGMKWGKITEGVKVVGDEVNIDIQLELQQKSATTTKTKAKKKAS